MMKTGESSEFFEDYFSINSWHGVKTISRSKSGQPLSDDIVSDCLHKAQKARRAGLPVETLWIFYRV